MTEEEKSSRNLTEEEFGRIFSRCRQMFVKIANSYIHDDSAAEDIVNECFIRMWEKRDELKTENYESYAFKSIVNRCLDHLKVENNRTRIQKNIYEASNRMQTYEINSLESLNPERLFADEINTLVEHCLKRMPEVTRKVFLASRIDEKTYGEISEIYGIPVRQVTSHIQFALKTLRNSLRDYLPLILAIIMLQTTETTIKHDNLNRIVNEIVSHSQKH